MMVQDSERKLQDDIYKAAIAKVDFNLPDEFLKRWLKATNEKLSEELRKVVIMILLKTLNGL
jgi:trigger factor